MTAGNGLVSVVVQACRACGRRWQVMLPSCPYCGTLEPAEEEVQATGSIYSWVEVFRALGAGPEDLPYTVVIAQLDAGARVFGRYQGAESIRAGLAVHATRRSAEGALMFVPSQLP